LLIGISPARAAPVPAMTLGAILLARPISTRLSPTWTLPQDLTVHAGPSPVPRAKASSSTGLTFSGSASTRIAPVSPIQDLTILPFVKTNLVSGENVVVDAGSVATKDDYAHGVDTFASGTTTITAGDITTSGRSADGIHAVGYGDITIKTGQVGTSGYRSEGIYANTNLGGATGSITVGADTVSTSGVAATGINAAAYHGGVAVTVGTVKTSGYGADGINAWSYDKDATITASTIATTGDAGRGIVAYSGGTTTVIADSVTTSGAGTGQDSDAGAIKAVGAAITVQAGNVATSGDYSAGIYAISNRVHDNGQADRDISVTADTVTTTGNASDGIDAVNYAGGKTSITANQVATSGDASWGIYAGGRGDISITGGAVDTKGANAAGIVATSVYGNVDVTASTVATHGDHANAINIENYSQNGASTITAGTISTDGAGSSGIYVGGSGTYQGAAHVVTIDAGAITTRGDLAAGLVVLTAGTVNVNVGDVTTEGPRARAIIVQTADGDINLTAGNVVTEGAVALGRDASAIAINSIYGNVSANIQSIATAGDHSSGIITSGLYSNQSFAVQDGITTTGAHSAGVFAVLQGGSLAIDSGTIATSGAGSAGINAILINGDTAVHVGDLTTLGDGSTGLNLQASSYDGIAHQIAVNTGTISTKGAYASGILATAQGGDVDVTSQSITTSGANSAGIAVAAGHEVDAAGNVYGGNVTVSAGTVSTKGDYANGIDTVATQSTSITADSVATAGAKATAIHAYGSGAMAINVGSISTAGDHADGVYAFIASGDVAIKADSVSATGLLSQGIRAASYSGNVTVDADTVTAGVGTGIDVRAGYGDHGNATITAGTILTNGAGIVALAGDDVRITVDGITTHSGTQDAGTQLGQAIKAVAHGGIDITAGTVATTGYQAEGVYAVAAPSANTDQAPGNITIDVGQVATSGAKSTGIYAVDTGYQTGGTQMVSIKAGPISTAGDVANGIYAVGGNVAITATGAVSTKGVLATGIYGAAVGGRTTIATNGPVSTEGDESAGIRGFSSAGGVDINAAGPITTKGDASYGALAFGTGGLTIESSGAVGTSGMFAHGLYAVASSGSAAITSSGGVTVTGFGADAIRAISNGGAVSVSSTGTVSASGDFAAGILAVSDRSGRGDPGYGAPPAGRAADVTVSAGTVLGSGAFSNGVATGNYSKGKTSIDVAKVVMTGLYSRGILANITGDLDIHAGAVQAVGNAIFTNGTGNQSITVTGSTISTADNAMSLNGVGDITLNVGHGATVFGGGHRDTTYGYGGSAVVLNANYGKGIVNNAGLIEGGEGYAIETGSEQDYYGNATSHTLVNNSGMIEGAVKFGAGADVLTNNGLFIATKDSDFGAGADSFVNTGTLLVRSNTKPSKLSLLGLEDFQNKGGLVDLRNGVAGDVLSLSGAYVGSAGALLGLDLIGGKVDQLQVTGAATGHSAIILDIVGKDARLLGTPVTLVAAGKGSGADAFSVANADIGLIHYDVRYDAATGRFALTADAGAAVYRTLAIPRAAQAIWHRAADAWDAHMAEKRDARLAGGDGFGSRLWGQAYGGVDTQDGHRTLDGNSIETGYRQDYYGAQIGLDLAGKTTDKGGMLFGVTGSYISSKLNGHASTDRTQFDSLELGGYASFLSGPLFANLLGQYGHDWIRTNSIAVGYSDKLKGDSYGGELQVGARLGKDSLYVEPSASIAYVRSDIGNLEALGQTIDFDKRDGLRGKLGGRIGSAIKMTGGGTATLYLQASYVHDFKGKNGLDLLSGGSSRSVSGVQPGDYSQGALGVNILSAGRASGFIEGDADVGGGVKGGGGRVGISFKL
jgi:hypothetical protein